MSWLPVTFEDLATLRRDLREGRARVLVRLALSLFTALLLVAILLAVLGIIDHVDRVHDESIAFGLGLIGFAWCIALVMIWRGFSRFSIYLMGVVYTVGIWTIVIPTAAVLAEISWRNELFVAAIIFAGIAATLFLWMITLYRGVRGRQVRASTGEVDVRCPRCGYSMVGLSECTCPECGHAMTIDGLIEAQKYDAHVRTRRLNAAAHDHAPAATAARGVAPSAP